MCVNGIPSIRDPTPQVSCYGISTRGYQCAVGVKRQTHVIEVTETPTQDRLLMRAMPLINGII